MSIAHLIGFTLLLGLALAIVTVYLTARIFWGAGAQHSYATNPSLAAARYGAPDYTAWLAAQPFYLRLVC